MSLIPFRRNPWLLLILLLAFALRSKALACEALSRFERLTANDAVWPIYDLAAPAEPSVAPHSTEIQTPFAVSFGEQLELRGVSLKQLLSWPSAYQVIYYLEISKAAGDELPSHRAHHQRRRPDGLSAGLAALDHIEMGSRRHRPRSILLLPTSLPEGKYRMQIGWSDDSGVRKQENSLCLAEMKSVSRPGMDG